MPVLATMHLDENLIFGVSIGMTVGMLLERHKPPLIPAKVRALFFPLMRSLGRLFGRLLPSELPRAAKPS